MTANQHVLETAFDPNGYFYARLNGAITPDRLEQLRADVAASKLSAYNEFQKRGAKFKSVIDLTNFEGTYVPEAISILSELMKSNKSYVEKSAAFGGSDTTTFAANMVASIAQRENLGFFKTKEEALAWLNAA